MKIMNILTENTVLARTRAQDLNSVRKLNCWGCELTNVEIIRKMPNVEVLSLSVNEISTLADFSHCPNLQELYIRKNNIHDLREVRHLRGLNRLQSLWLSDNPCAETPDYRMAVLRALPHLHKLDNIIVKPEEIERALLQGPPLDSPPADDEAVVEVHHSSCAASNGTLTEVCPTRSLPGNHVQSLPDLTLADEQPKAFQARVQALEDHQERTVAEPVFHSSTPIEARMKNDSSPEPDSTASVVEESIKSFSLKSMERSSYVETSTNPGSAGGRHHSSSSSSTVRVLPKGGKNRNSNILSAVLCLIKELDYPSLEVIETAIHCRMEELEE